MVGELITLPLRFTGAVVRLWWRTTEQAIDLASGAAGLVIERARADGAQPPDSEPWAVPTREPAVRPAPEPAPKSTWPHSDSTEEPSPAPPVVVPRATESHPVARAEEPAHVSEEPELVEAFAEPGAEDGAGAELHIQEPWEGYRQMTAREVVARLARASAAELAAVQLYETSNQGRQTVLAAVARQHRVMNGSGPRTRGGTNSDA